MQLLFVSIYVFSSCSFADEITGDGYGDEPFTPIYKIVKYTEERELIKDIEKGKPNLQNILLIKPSGYRQKRTQNSYGDETNTDAPIDVGGYEPETEETAPPADNGYEPEETDVYPSGYRRKRAGENSYGDEAVTPEGTEGYQAVTEETQAPIYNEASYGDRAPEVAEAGYRKVL